ncbi:MAG: hypothetical protein WCV84_02830 [Patescibacteria group bacterium]
MSSGGGLSGCNTVPNIVYCGRMQKTFWRCSVCGDLHYGVNPANPCPTCGAPATKAEAITREEFLKTFEE